MNSKFTFNPHNELKGTHALFSPSQSSWLGYDDNKIADRVLNQYRAPLGTEIHEYAAMEIRLNHRKRTLKSVIHGIESYIYSKYSNLSPDGNVPKYYTTLIENVTRLPKEVFELLVQYINDGIGFKMTTEQPIKYSENIYGTADTIAVSLDETEKSLRIHDLKTGDNPGHMDQLVTYAALFCLEYGSKYNFKPQDLTYELRLYQWDEIIYYNPTPEEIINVMNQIIHTEKIASRLNKEV